MLITVNADGKVEFTRKPELLALFEGQPKSIIRMTEVEFDTDRQKFHVRFLKGPRATELLTVECIYEGQGRYSDEDMAWLVDRVADQVFFDDDGVMYFDTYEDGVKAEIIVVEAMRRAGHSMHQ